MSAGVDLKVLSLYLGIAVVVVFVGFLFSDRQYRGRHASSAGIAIIGSSVFLLLSFSLFFFKPVPPKIIDLRFYAPRQQNKKG